MQKTSSHIEIVPLRGTVTPDTTIVRPPMYLKVVRCTVIFQSAPGTGDRGLLSTVPEQNDFNSIQFANSYDTTTLVPPAVDSTIIPGIQTFVFDRLGVGYMTDEFYVSSSGSGSGNFVFIWEGINQSL